LGIIWSQRGVGKNINHRFARTRTFSKFVYEIYAKEQKWDACQGIAAALLKQAPERPHGWLHLAYSARRATGYMFAGRI